MTTNIYCIFGFHSWEEKKSEYSVAVSKSCARFGKLLYDVKSGGEKNGEKK